MIRRRVAGVWLLLAVLGCRSAPASGPALARVSDGRYAMGTVLEITLVGRPGRLAQADLDPLYDRVAELEALLSHWDLASATSRLNAAAGRGPQPVPRELARILRDAGRYTEQTRGTFDVTLGALSALWTEAARRDRRPDAAELAAARARVGSDALRVLGDGRVELVEPGMALDFGGLAKGWALDRLREGPLPRHLDGALLSFGQSSSLGLGSPPEGGGWRVLLRGAADDFLGVLTLRDRALSVSASLGQWSSIGARRYGHVIDPRSGEALTDAWLAAVVAPSAAAAEAWTKALLVLGAEAGLPLLETDPELEGLMADAAGRLFETSGWREAVDFEPVR